MQYQSLAIWTRIADLWSRCALEPPIDPRDSLEAGVHALMELLDAAHADIQLHIKGEGGPDACSESTERLAFAAVPAKDGRDPFSSGSTLSTTLEPMDEVEATIRIARTRAAADFSSADAQVLDIAADSLVRVLASFIHTNGLLPHQTRLSSREQRVLTLLAGGHRSIELAKMLEIDPDRIEDVIDGITDRLGAASRVELLHLVMTRAPGAGPPTQGHDSATPTPDTMDEPAPDPFLRRVFDAIRRQLAAEHLTTQAVARLLGVSKRTLQRKLAAADTTFRQMTDRARHQRALELLANPSMDYTDVAHELGYGHVSSLNRALQRWTGETPSEVRAALRGRG